MDSIGIKAESEAASTGHPSRVSGAKYISIARQANGTFAERRIEAETLDIWAIEITGNHVGAAPILPKFLD